MRFDFVWYFFSFKGRINREEFWLGYVGLTLVLLLLRRPLAEFGLYLLGPGQGDLDELNFALGLPLMVAAAIAAWPTCAIYAKRLHDLNFSGWWLLVLPAIAVVEVTTRIDQIELVMLVIIAIVGSLRGQRGSNRFGDDPLS